MKPRNGKILGAEAPVTERQRVEYDCFGPWTYAVRTPEEMPPRFDPWYREVADSSLILKLPIHAERRDLRAGEDLYEAVLAVGPRGLVHLGLDGGELRRRSLSFGEISAIRLVEELLYGELGFDLADGSSFELLFNAVSLELFGEFVGEVRGHCAAREGGRCFVPVELDPGPSAEDTFSTIMLKSAREREPGLGLLAYQAPCVMGPRKGGGRRGLVGLAARLARWRLDGCLLSATPSEILVLQRGTGAPRHSHYKGYRHELIYLPSAAFAGAVAETRSLANGAPLHVLRLAASGHEYELLFERDHAPALAALGAGGGEP